MVRRETPSNFAAWSSIKMSSAALARALDTPEHGECQSGPAAARLT
jgi:hypothetical protein